MKTIDPDNEFETIIRLGMIEDVDRLNDIEKACFQGDFRYGPSILGSLLSMTHVYIFLIVQNIRNSKIIAFAVGEQDNDDKSVGRIMTIQVDPQYQRRKVGSELLLELEKKLKSEYMVKTIELQVHYQNKRAINFYKKHGFQMKKELRNYYKRKEHAFLMEKIVIKTIQDKKLVQL